MRTRNYNFKWWHGVLGLIGLSMVLGVVRVRATLAPPAAPERLEYPYRGTTIVIEPSVNQPGYVVEVFAISGERLQWNVLGTIDSGKRWAEDWVDLYIRRLGAAP